MDELIDTLGHVTTQREDIRMFQPFCETSVFFVVKRSTCFTVTQYIVSLYY